MFDWKYAVYDKKVNLQTRTSGTERSAILAIYKDD